MLSGKLNPSYISQWRFYYCLLKLCLVGNQSSETIKDDQVDDIIIRKVKHCGISVNFRNIEEVVLEQRGHLRSLSCTLHNLYPILLHSCWDNPSLTNVCSVLTSNCCFILSKVLQCKADIKFGVFIFSQRTLAFGHND